MENNIFEFGDMYFKQLTGTAMGTSAACLWATIYFAIHEDFLLAKYKDDILLYKRFIDDMFGIWIGSNLHYAQFQVDTDNFGSLRWDFEPLGPEKNFLDLTISIGRHGEILTRTYQKPINLYHYLPPHSAHAPHIMKGVIYSLLRQYKRQNTLESDYIKQAKLLFQRLVARGWDPNVIKQYTLKADTRLRSTERNPPQIVEPPLTNKELAILHWTFHPNDISSKLIRRLYDVHCKATFTKTLGIQQFTIALHAAPNISSVVTRAKLIQEHGKEASKYFDGEPDP